VWRSGDRHLLVNTSKRRHELSYIFRATNTELWQAFKLKAAQEGHSLRWLLEQLIKRYVERGLD